ncbi:MAG: Copper-exporting P-type ATPase A [Chlamydiae bacterium]|nr:Copper-exporting P-type ATPase A [Chlamydiota bacterium]
METTEIKIEGMHCVSCERTITNALKAVPGVEEASVSFVAGEARIKCEEGKTDHEALIKAIHTTGYRGYLIEGKNDAVIEKGEARNFRIQLISVILSALFTLPLFYQMFVDMFGWGEPLPLWVQFALATIVQFGFGWRFYVGSYYALKTLTGNMDLLIALGTSAAYFYSTVIFLADMPRHLYFESSASIITLILLGRLLELRTKRKASSAITELVKLQPKTARVQKDGEWQEVPIEKMVVGDLFQVRPGESTPIDGEVVDGSSYLDESMLTGESIPVHKKMGDSIFGGTHNQQGAFTAKATAVGSNTALASIIRLVKEAQSSQAPIQRLADKISAVFVPIVVAISLVTFFVWWGVTKELAESLINAVSVLVIACPCALGMATPTVIMVASGRGAKAGILIRNAEAIQAAEKLEIIAVDKTGTLTEGKPSLTDILPDTEEARQIGASLETLSEHPIGQTLATASKEHLPVEEFLATPGKGVSGLINGKLYKIGSLKWAEEQGIPLDRKVTDPLEREGKTVVALTSDHELLSLFAVADTLRLHSKEGVGRLQTYGIEVVMLTGDHPQTAQAIASQVGISKFFAEILPEKKAETVTELMQSGKKVGMVGDGINDAPALATADVGFSMRSGTDIAMSASDITLMQNDMRHVADAISLSRATFKKVRQNLFFAFFYNSLGIPLAAVGLLNPIFAGAAMALSSLCVVGNSLLLNRWKP